MKRYFELLDDISVTNRWHLGEATSGDGTEPRLRAGIPLLREGAFTVSIDHPGRALDFTLTSFAVPVASSRVARKVSAIAGADLQCLPVDISGQSGMVALNSIRVVDCLDEDRSEFVKWTHRDHRTDLAGQYRQVTRLVADPNAIPHDAHFFRTHGWHIALIVSEDVKKAMACVGCAGAKFIEVSP